jgi:hypothetical protein
MSDGANNVKPRSERREVKANYFSLFTLYFLLFTLLFSTGCSQKQQAVDLYVDAVMLRPCCFLPAAARNNRRLIYMLTP